MDVVHIDFRKAFAKVSHGRLVWKVTLHGILGELAIWIQNWLGGRTQWVIVEGHFFKFESCDQWSATPVSTHSIAIYYIH